MGRRQRSRHLVHFALLSALSLPLTDTVGNASALGLASPVPHMMVASAHGATSATLALYAAFGG